MWKRLLLVCGLLVIGLVARAESWITFHGDGALTGVAKGPLPARPVRLWARDVGGEVTATPVSDGERVYYATDKGRIGAVALNGDVAWTVNLPVPEGGGPNALAPSIEVPLVIAGPVVAGCTRDGTVYAFDPKTGAQRWVQALEDETVVNALGVAADHERGRTLVLVIGQEEGRAYALDALTGKRVWRTQATTRSDASPSMDGGRVVFGSCAAKLHVYDLADGGHVADVELGENRQVAGGVALVNGVAFAGDRMGGFWAVDLEKRRVLWSDKGERGEAFGTPAVTATTVIFAAADGSLHAFDRATGKSRWQATTPDDPGSPAVVGDHVVVAGDGYLVTYALGDGAKLWSVEVSDMTTGPVITGGRIIVGTDEGQLVAFGGGG